MDELLLKLLLASLALERALTVLFSISTVKELISTEGRYMKGTDLKAGIALALGFIIAMGLDWRVLSIIASTESSLAGFRYIDYYMTGALISGGSDFMNNFIRRFSASRKLAEEAAKKNGNGQQNN